MKKIITKLAKEFNVATNIVGQSCFDANLWRDKKPVWNKDRCFKCGICYLSCPDAAVVLVDDGFYDVDADRCKGCGVCEQACINEAIVMTPEEK